MFGKKLYISHNMEGKNEIQQALKPVIYEFMGLPTVELSKYLVNDHEIYKKSVPEKILKE